MKEFFTSLLPIDMVSGTIYGIGVTAFIIGLIWSFAWKGLALWKASKNNHLVVFIILLVLNTVGVAEIIYLLYLYFKNKKTTGLPRSD